MKSGSVDVDFGSQSISLETTAELVERIIGHFLYHRGQIEKPLAQLQNDKNPGIRMELQYSERSTPYKCKGNEMFATPLNNGYATPGPKRDVSMLTESMKNFSIHEEQDESNLSQIIETPVTTRVNGGTVSYNQDCNGKRRVMGKLQQVSVPITPKLNLKKTKFRDGITYLIEVLDNIKSHIIAGWKITNILLLIGTTPMSPRESYCIDLTRLGESEGADDVGKCLSKIMQALFIDPFMNNLPSTLPLSNCYFLLHVDRRSLENYTTAFFEPRLRFYQVERGVKFQLNLTNLPHLEPVEGSESDFVYFAAPKPFKGLRSFTGKTPKPEKGAQSQENCAKDFLDTIHC